MALAITARIGPLGSGKYIQVTDLSAAVAPVIPANGSATRDATVQLSDYNVVLMTAETQNVRWRDDGTAPTATVGNLLVKNTPFLFRGDINKLQVIEATASASISYNYYSVPGGALSV